MIIGDFMDYTYQCNGEYHNPSGESGSTNQSEGTTQGFEQCSFEKDTWKK